MPRRVWTGAAATLAALCTLGFRCPGATPSAADRGRGGAGGGSSSTAGGGPAAVGGMGGVGGVGGDCDPGSVDFDGDGVALAEGDCDDCDSSRSPRHLEIAGNDIDDDCDGAVDEPAVTCDDNLGESVTPGAAAAAMDLCSDGNAGSPSGLQSARWTRIDGSELTPVPVAVALAASFGTSITPRRGARMVVMSTGTARDDESPEGCDGSTCTTSGPSPTVAELPLATSCQGSFTLHDDVVLEVTVGVPTNVHGYRFDLGYLTFEFPQFVCSGFDDQFAALASPAPAGAVGGNLTTDGFGVPLSALSSFITHCDDSLSGQYAMNCNVPPCPSAPDPLCPNDSAWLAGTGFDGWSVDSGGGTGWLRTVVPAIPGEVVTLRLALYEGNDGSNDSTVFIDNFRWVVDPVPALETKPLD